MVASVSLNQDAEGLKDPLNQSEGFWEAGLLLPLLAPLLNPPGYFSVAAPCSLLRPPVVRLLSQAVIMCLAKAGGSVSDPRRGPPSCNKWLLWRVSAATDILTTWGTQGPACLLMDQTQQPQLGSFSPWSPPDTDNWPKSPDRARNKRLY